MQDYKRFIDEINSLDVRTKKLFVKDGQVIQDVKPEWYEGHPQDRWPGYVATFYDFDHYNEALETDKYAAKLTDLREAAFSDVFSLTGEQLFRLVADLKTKKDKMSRLAMRAKELIKAYNRTHIYENVSDIEYAIFSAFPKANKPDASFEPLCTYFLTDAFEAKRNSLTELIYQLEPSKQDVSEEKSEKGNSTKTTAKPQSKFFIIPEVRQLLYDTLLPYINEPDQINFKALLFEDKQPTQPIQHHSQQNALAYIFCQLERRKSVHGSYACITEWICKNFAPATYSTIFDVVRGQKEPKKSSQIKITL